MAHHQGGSKVGLLARSSIQKMGHKTGTAKSVSYGIYQTSFIVFKVKKRRSCRCLFGGISMMGGMKTLPFRNHVPIAVSMCSLLSGDALSEAAVSRAWLVPGTPWHFGGPFHVQRYLLTVQKKITKYIRTSNFEHHHARTSTSKNIYKQCLNIAEPYSLSKIRSKAVPNVPTFWMSNSSACFGQLQQLQKFYAFARRQMWLAICFLAASACSWSEKNSWSFLDTEKF